MRQRVVAGACTFIVLVLVTGPLRGVADAGGAGCTVGISVVACPRETRTVVVAQSGEADFHRIQPALDAARPGDTILIRAGRYVEPVVLHRSGTPLAPITLRAYPGERPSLSPSGDGGGESYLHVRGSWLIVEGLEVSGGLHGVVVSGSHNVVRGNHIHDNGVGCPVDDYCGQGVIVASASDVVITGNLVERNGLASSSPWHVHGIYLSGYYGRPVSRISVTDNAVRSHGGAGIHVWDRTTASHVLIQRNRLEDNVVDILLSNARQVLVHGNVVDHTSHPRTDAPRSALLWLEFVADAVFEGNSFRLRPAASGGLPGTPIHLYASDQGLQELVWRSNTWDVPPSSGVSDASLNAVRRAEPTPTAPTLVSARSATNPTQLSWFSGIGADATSYELTAGSAPGTSDLARLDLGRLSDLTAISPEGRQVFVRVTARNAAGSAASNEVLLNTSVRGSIAPWLLPPVVVGQTVRLEWAPVGSGDEIVLLVRLVVGGPVIARLPVSPGNTSLTVNGVPAGSYLVSATAGAGSARSPESAAVSVHVR